MRRTSKLHSDPGLRCGELNPGPFVGCQCDISYKPTTISLCQSVLQVGALSLAIRKKLYSSNTRDCLLV